MAVIAVNEQWQERTTKIVLGERKHKRRWLVKTNNRFDGSFVAATATNIPVIGDTHPDDGAAYCIDVNSAPYVSNSPFLWTVTADYSSKNEFTADPTLDPANISWSTEQFQQVLWRDRNGDGVVNSAGDPFDPPSMKDFSRRVAKVTKNISAEPVWLLDYEDGVNSGPFSIRAFAVAAQLAKLQRIEISDVQTRGVYEYHVLSFEIHLSKNGWKEERLDEGFRRKDGTKRIPIYEKDDDGNEIEGEKVTAPVPLDGSGGILANPTPSNVVYRQFEGYDLVDFSVLPLT